MKKNDDLKSHNKLKNKYLKVVTILLICNVVGFISLNIYTNYKINKLYASDFLENMKKSEVLENQIGKFTGGKIPFLRPYDSNNGETCINFKLKTSSGMKLVCAIYSSENKKIIINGYVIDDKVYYDLPEFKISDYQLQIDNNPYNENKNIEFNHRIEYLSEISNIISKDENYSYHDSNVYFDKESNSYLVIEKQFDKSKNIIKTVYVVIKDNKVISLWEE